MIRNKGVLFGEIILFSFACIVNPSSLLQAQSVIHSPDRYEQINPLFNFVLDGDPGCSLGIIEQNRLSYEKNVGLANLDWRVPISTSSIFDIASVSKQFTATAIALLEIDGLLQIDDDVRKWIPDFKGYERPITIRHLLNHTSGIRDYLSLMNLAGIDFNNVFTEFDAVDLIVSQDALNFPPGDQFLYSNSGYLLAAHIVRLVTGQSLRSFLEERVFSPLGMTNTLIWDDNQEIVRERTTGYNFSSEKWEIDHLLNFQMGGDGQVLSSIEDLAKWDANFYQPAVGGTPLLDRLHTRGILNNGDTIDYALGLTVDEYRGLKRVMHTGSWGGFRANITRYPNQKTTFILLCNRSDGTQNLNVTNLADIVLADHFTEVSTTDMNLRSDGAPLSQQPQESPQVAIKPKQPDLNSLEEYIGEYRSAELGVSFLVDLKEQRLTLERPNGVTTLSYSGNNRFAGDGLIVSFTGDNQMKIDTDRVLGIKFSKSEP